MHVIASMPAMVGVAAGLPAWGEDLIVPLLILLVGLTLGIGICLLTLLAHTARKARSPERVPESALEEPRARGRRDAWSAAALPNRWLAVRVNNPQVVQMALNLHRPTPCSWDEGLAMAQDHRLFITSCVNGWVLVLGADLPDPAEDVDQCFLFLTHLSRKLGVVQFFSVNRVLNHHAWACADHGAVVRAYAWAERTLWNQGRITRPEIDLGMTCFSYAETVERVRFGAQDPMAANTERVPQLAARWSLDPAALNLRRLREWPGIVGEMSRSRIH